MSEIIANLKDHVFFHGTTIGLAHAIATGGFRSWFDCERYRQFAYPTFGAGTYVTCDYRTALNYGGALLRVELRPGSRLLDCSVPADRKVIAYLRKEFGKSILADAPRKVLPRNKQLTKAELVALTRHHYPGLWMARRRRSVRAYKVFPYLRSLLLRYQFHGFGHPGDLNGIVVFAPERLQPAELIGEVPMGVDGGDWCHRGCEDFAQDSLEAFRAKYPPVSAASRQIVARLAAGLD